MPEIQLFLTLEQQMLAVLQREFVRQNREALQELRATAQEGRFSAADQTVDRLTFRLDEDAIEELIFVGLNAVLLGAGLARGIRRKRSPRGTIFESMSQVPAELEMAVRQMAAGLFDRGAFDAKALARRVLNDAELEDPTKPLAKAERDLGRDAAEAAVEGGGYKASVSANLTTSRLVSYGFVRQSQEDGLSQWQWNAVLDRRTCPVCRGLHGMEFALDSTAGRLFTALSTQDPQELKSITPWPSQTRAGVARFSRMSPEEIQAQGVMPPAHPGCRCVPSPVGEVPAGEIEGFGDVERPEEELIAATADLDRLLQTLGLVTPRRKRRS